MKNHDHSCHCGTGPDRAYPHETGQEGCVRLMTDPPDPTLSEFTIKQQRGYHQHPCGCWSRFPDSVNSLEGEW